MNNIFILLALVVIQTSLPAENIEVSLPEQNANIILTDADTIAALSLDLLKDDWASRICAIRRLGLQLNAGTIVLETEATGSPVTISFNWWCK